MQLCVHIAYFTTWLEWPKVTIMFTFKLVSKFQANKLRPHSRDSIRHLISENINEIIPTPSHIYHVCDEKSF